MPKRKHRKSSTGRRIGRKGSKAGELNVLLDMDKKDQVLLDDGEGVEIEPEQKKKERER